MNKGTKILTILIFVFSLGVLFFTAKTISTIEMQKKLINSMRDNLSSLQDSVSSLNEILSVAKDEIVSLNTEKDRLEKELTFAIEEKEKALEDLAVAQNENKRLNSELSEARDKLAVLIEKTTTLEKKGTDLTPMITELENNLRDTKNKLKTAEDRLAKLESIGILVDREAIPPGEGKTPELVKAIEGKIVGVKPSGVVAINFKGSIKPQKGTTFYIINSDEVKAKLTLEEIYNTIMVARMEVEREDYNINDGDEVRLILWTEETKK
jgi:predicted  nucleic acid-binding Zn-ribbon protein